MSPLLVFVCSVIGVVAPSYEMKGNEMDLDLEVFTLLYIAREGRVTMRGIG